MLHTRLTFYVSAMSEHTVYCARKGASLPGLDAPPLKSPLGERIYREISSAAWREWLQHATRLINEKKLSPHTPKDEAYLAQQAEQFLFGDGGDRPEGYIPLQRGAQKP